MVLAAQDLIPPATADPIGVWFFNWVIPIARSVFIVLAVADVVRRRRVTWARTASPPRRVVAGNDQVT